MLGLPPDLFSLTKYSLEISFSGQEAVPIGAVVDKSRFEAGLDAGNLAFVYVGFFAFASRCFDIEVVKTLAIDHRHAQLFFLSRVD